MFNVLMMRFNVVIGGQEIAKTGKGLLTFPWEIFGREGVLAAAAVLVAPFHPVVGGGPAASALGRREWS